MSHVACPVCGLCSSLETFDPESHELDVKVVRFRGLGYKKGFAVDEQVSVLGDDVICPILARRVVEVMKMFLDAGVLDIVDVIKDLGVTFENVGTYSDVDVLKLIRERDYYLSQSNSIYHELSEMKNKEKERKRVDEKLKEIHDLIRCEICLSRESEYVLKLNNMYELKLFLTFCFNDMNYELRKRVIKRIVSDDLKITSVLEFLSSMPREKTLADELVDCDLSTLTNVSFPPSYVLL